MKPLRALINKNNLDRFHKADKSIKRIDPKSISFKDLKPGMAIRFYNQGKDAVPFLIVSGKQAKMAFNRSTVTFDNLNIVAIHDDDKTSFHGFVYMDIMKYDKTWPHHPDPDDTEWEVVDLYITHMDPEKEFKSKEDVKNWFKNAESKGIFNI